jgi:hypothetical protein
MADTTITALSHPGFQQVLHTIIGQEFQRIERVLGPCAYESQERHPGSCDGGVQCQKRATVHDFSTGEEFCLEHFDGLIL